MSYCKDGKVERKKRHDKKDIFKNKSLNSFISLLPLQVDLSWKVTVLQRDERKE